MHGEYDYVALLGYVISQRTHVVFDKPNIRTKTHGVRSGKQVGQGVILLLTIKPLK